MGHDLHGFAQVVALALTLDDMLVDLARGDVVVACEGDVEVALVVAEIEVDFAAVGENEYFAMPVQYQRPVLGRSVGWSGVLLWVHSPRIDIEVGVDFDRRDVLRRQYAHGRVSIGCTHLQANGLEQQTGRGGYDAYGQRWSLFYRTHSVLGTLETQSYL